MCCGFLKLLVEHRLTSINTSLGIEEYNEEGMAHR